MIKVAVLGLGQMGATHVEAAQASPYVSQIYGYEPDEARRNERAAELKITPLTLEEILADESIQMVDIVASNDAHVPLAKAALLAGKKVLCASSQSNPSQRRSETACSAAPGLSRGWSRSSMRKTTLPPCARARSQATMNVRTFPRCRAPVGLGANLPTYARFIARSACRTIRSA